jgi:hypothetical protein
VALGKREHEIWNDKDELELIRLAESEAAPLLRHRHQETISGSLGLAKVHSMYVDDILKWARSHHLDPHELILKVREINRTRVDEEILKSASLKTSGDQAAVAKSEGLLAMPSTTGVFDAVRAAENLAEKRGVTCTLWIIGGGGDTKVRVIDDVDGVDVRISGSPRPAIKAASRPPTRICIHSSCGETVSTVQGWTPLPVEVADESLFAIRQRDWD